MNTITAQSGVGFQMKKGERLKVVDLFGSQVSDLFCFNQHDHAESLSTGRSMDYNDTLYLTEGHTLYSNRSQPMMRFVQDTCGRHDILMPPCSLKMFQIVAGNLDYHPSCHENLALNLHRFGISPDQISTTLNLFMNVVVNAEGQIRIEKPQSKAGDYGVLEALMDLTLGLTACSHEESNDGCCKPIGFSIERFK